MSKALLLSLGHNSSAIYTDGKKVIGYETERLDRVKSSSASPILAIKEIEKHENIEKNTPVFATHWFDSWNTIPECKYSTDLHGFAKAKGLEIQTHTKEFTHHDAHAWSVKSFFDFHSKNLIINKDEEIWIIVADGFGNMRETISIYKYGEKDISLVNRCFGYETSLGLFYQYATDFVGMKMNQDEYKFLGYESMLDSFFSEQHSRIIDSLAGKISDDFFILFNERNVQGLTESLGDLINLQNLSYTKGSWQRYFQLCLDHFNIVDRTSVIARVLIANIIQRAVENTLVRIIQKYNMKNVLLAGGIFYNVKLNNKILKEIPGLFSVVPVAGDQGAAIGFYEKYVGNFNWITLAIGDRHVNEATVLDIMKCNPNVYVPRSKEEAAEIILRKIKSNEIVNLVRSKMEYGPRALGHTSSLFLPTGENSAYNNFLNERNEVMPFAPMIHYSKLHHFFNPHYTDRVIGSDKFMILTYDYEVPMTPDIAGVMHKNPLTGRYTGRPQVVDSSDNFLNYAMFELNKNRIPIITNTSYNYHGEPIVFSMQDIIKTHYKQLKRSWDNKIVNLVIYRDECE